MTGARLVAEFDDAEFRLALHRLGAAGRNPTGLLRAIGSGLVANTMHRFTTERSPTGAQWTPLNPAYAAAKGSPGILKRSGLLQRSITMRTGPNRVIVGSNRIYAGVHQFGATIRPVKKRALAFRIGTRLVFARQVRIPARPYLGLGPEDRETIMDALDVLLPGGRAR